MAKRKDTLKHVKRAVMIIKEMFLLDEWTIQLVAVDEFDDNTLIKVILTPDIRHAKIEVPPEMRVNPKGDYIQEWLKGIIHEMLHIRMGLVTEGVVQRQLKDHKDPDAFWDTFVSEFEPTVQMLTHIIYDQWIGWPKKE